MILLGPFKSTLYLLFLFTFIHKETEEWRDEVMCGYEVTELGLAPLLPS